MLSGIYAKHFPESFDAELEAEVVYIGPHKIDDEIIINEKPLHVGKLLLSPTRTFAPVMKAIFENHFDAIAGLVHSSGGGQTKCMKFMPEGVRVIKDNLHEVPPIFKMIQESSGAEDSEMYQVFNMGTRMEIYTNEKWAEELISISRSFGVDAKIIGRVEAAEKNELVIRTGNGEIIY
jgi:phosphoribosylformylglycinamidine cyclo-ligase